MGNLFIRTLRDVGCGEEFVWNSTHRLESYRYDLSDDEESEDDESEDEESGDAQAV